MRAVFGVLSLLVVLAVVGILVKRQLGASGSTAEPAGATAAGVVGRPSGTPQQQVQQVQQAVQDAMQPRPLPDEGK
jgi:hypothetical protein